ncbi:hypothetical protein KA005_07880 [bacterium]|nr:hypothetical protein [bacterium]
MNKGMVSRMLSLLFPALALSLMIAENVSSQQGLLLEAGVGLSGKMEIGEKPLIGMGEKEFNEQAADYGLTYNTGVDGRIILIKCKKNCVAGRNITIGDSEKLVLHRYGPPLEKKELKENKIFYGYQGVGFRLKSSKVETIYILP